MNVLLIVAVVAAVVALPYGWGVGTAQENVPASGGGVIAFKSDDATAPSGPVGPDGPLVAREAQSVQPPQDGNGGEIGPDRLETSEVRAGRSVRPGSQTATSEGRLVRPTRTVAPRLKSRPVTRTSNRGRRRHGHAKLEIGHQRPDRSTHALR